MLAAVPVLLAGSGFFSGSETALFTLSAHQRRRLAQSKTIIGAAIGTLLHETRALLITLLLGNMVINVFYAAMTTILLLHFKRHGAGAALIGALTAGFLLALILFGEVMPKLVASRLPETWSRIAAVPLLFIHRVIGPVRIALNVAIITPLARLIAPPQRPPALDAEEIETLLELSEASGIIDVEEENLLRQVLELSQLKVRDLMTPRVDIVAHDLDGEPQRLIDLLSATRLSHVPVYHDDLDHIAGMVRAREALAARPRTRRDLALLVRQAVFVPELQRADELLVQFRKTGVKVAIAVDEYGGTAGLVTLENVVEQMVGEIAGPYEPGDLPRVQQVEPGVWRVRADLPIHEWADAFAGFSPAADKQRGSHQISMGGLVMARLGRVPVAGDRIKLDNLTIEVEAMHDKRIGTLLLRLEPRVSETTQTTKTR